MTKRLILLALFCLPVLAWAAIKPVRMVAPSLQGVSCFGQICVEEKARLEHAAALHRSAAVFVEAVLGRIEGSPRTIFCSTTECYRAFGGGQEKAISYPWLGALISPGAWKPHFVRHELVHQVQYQELGAVGTMRAPLWLREGMAYSVSEPPAAEFPDQFRPLAAQYEEWVHSIAPGQLWATASGL